MIKSILAFTLLSLASAHKHADKTPLVWGVFSEECYSYFNKEGGIGLFLENDHCLKFTMSKLVGYLIVLGAVVVKVPQIMKILVNNSTKGISPMAYYVETTVYLQSAAYSMHLGLQFSVYGENLFMTAQNLAIIGLMWKFEKHIPTFQKVAFGAFVAVYSFALLGGMLPENAWAFVSSSTMLLSVISKIPQIA
jgi:mannose-P-dolichol utilization defect 1